MTNQTNKATETENFKTSTSSKQRIIFMDSTLRDGEQAPGAAMTKSQKVAIAKSLANMGVDVIEAGFACSSPEDWDAVNAIAQAVETTSTKVCSLARCNPNDIQKAATALAPAIERNAARIHVFIATSPKHMETKLRMTKDEVIEAIKTGVRCARAYCNDVEFSAEDAFNSEPDFLVRCVQTAVEAGATTINLPDTVGEAVHTQYGDFIKDIITKANVGDDIVFSVHCHNDKGFATSNSMFGLMAGARQVECCMNGIGERAGNAALEEIAMAIKSSPKVYPFEFQLDTTQIKAVSELVEQYTGFFVPNCKSIVGKTAYSHGSGVHQDGVIKAWENGIDGIYGAVNPRDAGYREQIVITRHSGVRGIDYVLKQMGITSTVEQVSQMIKAVKQSGQKVVTPQMLKTMYQAQNGCMSLTESHKKKEAIEDNIARYITTNPHGLFVPRNNVVRQRQ